MTNPDTPPALTDLIGLDPDFTGGLSVEEHLRRQRCGECDEALRERDEARDRVAELESAITWGTSCLSCSTVLDGAYEQTVRAEKAEARVAELEQQRDEARQRYGDAVSRISAAVNVQVWTNEDGKRFVFADDLLAALDPNPDATPTAAPQADEPTYTGTIGYDERTDRWTMTCSEHGEVYRSTDGAADAHDECIRAWQSHCTTVHGEEAEVDSSDWLVPHAREEFLRTEPLPVAAPDPAPHCGLCGSEDCPGRPGTGCSQGPYETYEPDAKPVPADGGEVTA